MKKTICCFILSLLCITVLGQQKDFEGIVVYRTEVHSKSPILSDRVLKSMFAMGNESTVFIKQGNYKQVYGAVTTYYIAKDRKVYNKFNNIDTLYFVDYSSDSATIKKITKSGEKKIIAGYECNFITIQSSDATRTYYYAPSLHLNPMYDADDAIGKYNVYLKETSSVYLANTEETETHLVSGTCIKVNQTQLDDSVFKLPSLPQKKFVVQELITAAEYTKPGGFEKFLKLNINNELGAKYLKLRRGEDSVSQQVIVRFMVNENGKVMNAFVVNKKEVNPKLAEEALRVVSSSPLWKPAVIYNRDNTVYWLQVPIIFVVTK